MRLPILFNLINQNRNQLFDRARWRLAIWYAGMMGIVIILSSIGVYQALVYAYRLTVFQKLDVVANELHEVLEPILEEPGELAPAATQVLPDLCLVNAKCLTPNRTKQLTSFQARKYHIRLYDPEGNLIAFIGKQKLPEQHFRDRQQVYVELETRDFHSWGFLQVEDNSAAYAIYIERLGWIFLVSVPILIIILLLISWYLAGRAMQPVRTSYQLLQQFTADAAHELRTPLAAIRATVESTLMMPDITEAEAKETIITIGRQNVRLSNLVADLLMLCRMDCQLGIMKQSTLIKERISLINLVKDIVEDFSSLALKSQIKLDLRLAVSRDISINGNYEQLYRMVSNLVSNALKYTPEKGTVNVVLTSHGKYALIKIEDTGIGIATTEQTKIFSRFYRIKGDRSRDTGGSGLGLAIAQAIALTHKGSIRVESKLGQGSIFTVFLPLRKK